MFRSMTAYVFKTVVTPFGQLTIELHSLNKKYLEVTTSLQHELAQFENDVKKVVGGKVHRGKVLVRISLKSSDQSTAKVIPNIALAKQLKGAWELMAAELELPKERGFKLSMLKDVEGIVQFEETLGSNKEFQQVLTESLEEALVDFVDMKKVEGKVLFEDASQRISLLEQWIDQIAVKADGASEAYRKKITDRIEEIVPGSVENEERILREVCVFAERIDVTEEITRFKSHIAQFRTLMTSDAASIGKKLEFLLQEMLREVNTTGAKTSDSTVQHLVVDMKSELEKIREQLQNIE